MNQLLQGAADIVFQSYFSWISLWNFYCDVPSHHNRAFQSYFSWISLWNVVVW